MSEASVAYEIDVPAEVLKEASLQEQVEAFCVLYSIPLDKFMEIITDQKVIPMIRGKAMEYNILALLLKTLDPKVWKVAKEDLNAQPGKPDEDVTVTHIPSGQKIVVESKSAVRSSLSLGSKRHKLQVPHFKVKCHRSRSNKKKKDTNDRYSIDAFAILVSNPANALFEANTGKELKVKEEPALRRYLAGLYNGASTDEELGQAAVTDWRCTIPADIEDKKFKYRGFIPRTPYVSLKDDPHWVPLAQIQDLLERVVTQRAAPANKSGS